MSSVPKTTVFTENTRVQIPAILTLVKMGYGYISLKTRSSKNLDKETNIFKDVFLSSLKKNKPRYYRRRNSFRIRNNIITFGK